MTTFVACQGWSEFRQQSWSRWRRSRVDGNIDCNTADLDNVSTLDTLNRDELENIEIMKIETEIKKWGNSLALRVTGIMAELPKFTAGTKVVVEVTEEGIVVKPAAKEKPKLRLTFTESELLADMTPAKAHADELAEPVGTEFGE